MATAWITGKQAAKPKDEYIYVHMTRIEKKAHKTGASAIFWQKAQDMCASIQRNCCSPKRDANKNARNAKVFTRHIWCECYVHVVILCVSVWVGDGKFG